MDPQRYFTENPTVALDGDAVSAIGLDSTGRDGDWRFPYTYGLLTDAERVILHAYWATLGHCEA
jgi:hypothetical protein